MNIIRFQNNKWLLKGERIKVLIWNKSNEKMFFYPQNIRGAKKEYATKNQ